MTEDNDDGANVGNLDDILSDILGVSSRDEEGVLSFVSVFFSFPCSSACFPSFIL